MANRTIGTEIKLTGEKEFNQQMKAINSGLKTTRSDMAALSAEFDDNANSIEALSSKQKLLQSSVDQHKAKVEALTQQYKAAAATYGENSYSAQKYRQQLNQATVALQKFKCTEGKIFSRIKGRSCWRQDDLQWTRHRCWRRCQGCRCHYRSLCGWCSGHWCWRRNRRHPACRHGQGGC